MAKLAYNLQPSSPRWTRVDARFKRAAAAVHRHLDYCIRDGNETTVYSAGTPATNSGEWWRLLIDNVDRKEGAASAVHQAYPIPKALMTTLSSFVDPFMRPFADYFKCDEHLIMSRSLTHSEVSELGSNHAVPPVWKQRESGYWEGILIPDIDMSDHPDYEVFNPIISTVINLRKQRQFDSLLTAPAASLGTYVVYLTTHWTKPTPDERIAELKKLGWSKQRLERTRNKEMKSYLSYHTVATFIKSRYAVSSSKLRNKTLPIPSFDQFHYQATAWGYIRCCMSALFYFGTLKDAWDTLVAASVRAEVALEEHAPVFGLPNTPPTLVMDVRTRTYYHHAENTRRHMINRKLDSQEVPLDVREIEIPSDDDDDSSQRDDTGHRKS